MPHINVVYPFVPDSKFDEVLPQVRAVAANVAPFMVCFKEFGEFNHGKSSVLYLKPVPSRLSMDGKHPALLALQQELEKAFPWCNELSNKSPAGYAPHLTVGNFSRQALPKFLRSYGPWKPMEFQVTELYLISRDGFDDPFHIRHIVRLTGNAAAGVPAPLALNVAPIAIAASDEKRGMCTVS